MSIKSEQYAVLVAERKACRLCDGLRNPADHELAEFDSDQIGPWSRLCGDLDARLMMVGQDWGDVRYYIQNHGLDDIRNRTTRTLEQLIHGIGVEVSLIEKSEQNRGVFLTNALLCLKTGGMQAHVEQQYFRNCGIHLRRQIEIVAPQVIVCLGQEAYEATLPLRAANSQYPPLLRPATARLAPRGKGSCTRVVGRLSLL